MARSVSPIGLGSPVCGIRMARAHLRLPADDPTDDFTLSLYLKAAQRALVADLGCPLTTQDYVEVLDAERDTMEDGRIQLWMRPVTAIVAVSNIHDADGVTEDDVSTGFGFTDDGIAFSSTWVAPTRRMRVRYTAGWPAGSVPENLVLACLMTMADLYANRETVNIFAGNAVVLVNPTAERLTRSFRRFN